jgi:hypothetical protein
MKVGNRHRNVKDTGSLNYLVGLSELCRTLLRNPTRPRDLKRQTD